MLVSGQKNTFGSVPSWRRKKYSTCDPGVSSPSGMIFVPSFVVVDPVNPLPGADVHAGGYVTPAGTLPEPQMIVVVGTASAVSATKQMLREIPSAPRCGSASSFS